MNTLHGFSVPSLTKKDDFISEEVSYDMPLEDAEAAEENLGDFPEEVVATGNWDMMIFEFDLCIDLFSNGLVAD